MSDAQQTSPSENSLRLFALVGYGLLLLACSNGLTGIAGVAIAYLKRAEARGTVYESHFSNMIIVFWVAFVLGALLILGAGMGMITVFAAGEPYNLVPSIGILVAIYAALVLFVVWYLYRIIRGFVRVLDGKAY
jgi:uncharacterized membrane protein